MTDIQQIIKRASKYGGERWTLHQIKEIIWNHYVKPQNYSIVMGTDSNLEPQWWVVTNREASILVKHGFDQAY